MRIPALKLLLGGAPEEAPDTARLASGFHTDKTDPPLLMIHGDQDPQMPINQSLELAGKYQDTGCAATLHVLHGGVHGGPDFYDRTRMTWVRQFLKTITKFISSTELSRDCLRPWGKILGLAWLLCMGCRPQEAEVSAGAEKIPSASPGSSTSLRPSSN